MLVFVVAAVVLMARPSLVPIGFVAAGETLVLGTVPAHTKELRVDDDRAQCPDATFTSIQAAVNAAGPGDTVTVCPGTYNEQVRINGHTHDGLVLDSLNPLAATIKWPVVEAPPLALVEVNEADHVSIRGFTISGPFFSGACSPERHEGVQFENAFDGRVTENHITLIRNANPTLYRCSEGDAVAIGRRLPVGFGAPGSATVAHNLIEDFQKNGVQAVNPGTFADVTHNVIAASALASLRAVIASNGVVVFRHAAAQIEHNEISNAQFSRLPISEGIILEDAPAGSSSIRHNFLHNNDHGIFVDGDSGLEVSHNEVANSISGAVTICGDPARGCDPETDSAFNDNFVHDNGGWGFLLSGANNNRLKGNKIERNGAAAGPPIFVPLTDGIHVDSRSSGNRIEDNHLTANLKQDCHDDSIGGGTSGTANTWEGNKGQTENRPALCMKE